MTDDRPDPPDDGAPSRAPVVRPHPNAYVVPDTRLVAGEYPGDRSTKTARAKLAACLDAGITVFVDLTHAHELVPYDATLAELARQRGVDVDYHRLPIRDMDVCEVDHMRDVLDTIDRALDAGRTVYVHCWGGVGRTGTTVGCWLVRHGLDGATALNDVGSLFRTMSPAKRARHPEGSPQTLEQRRFVTAWREVDAHPVSAERVVVRQRDQPAPPDESRRPSLDRVRGSLMAGAVGDALGAPVEFLSSSAIRERFGRDGITSLQPAYGRVGAVTDDTQMTMFTVEGMLRSVAWRIARGALAAPDEGAAVVHGSEPAVMWRAYQRWLATQGRADLDADLAVRSGGWLIGLPSLHARRAPGMTCLSALGGGQLGSRRNPVNDSKGCGGVMRAAPFGLVLTDDAFASAADAAALTHGHPSGFLAAGALAVIVQHVATGAALDAAVDAALGRLATEPAHLEVTDLLDRAIDAWHAGREPSRAIERLGQGWVADEALGIAVYAALAAEGDLRRGLTLAANHSGDTDSTASIAGNILGAMLGPSAIPSEWLDVLELRAELDQLATDLYIGWQPGEAWARRYPAS